MISVVCVANDRAKLERCLLPGLENQSVEFELIIIDNSANMYESAAKALNFGGMNAKGKYIVFVHQDVCIPSTTWLEEVEAILDEIQKLGIAGVAGRKDRNDTVTNITHGEVHPRPAGLKVDSVTAVQTVDECLFIIPRCVLDELPFDEKVCNDWHFYAVDYSLSVARKGLGVYVLPTVVHHMSDFTSLSTGIGGYYSTLKRILRKHRNNIGYVYTTTGVWNTHRSVMFQRTNSLVISQLRRMT